MGETSMKPAWEGSDAILKFECHLDIQADSSNNVCSYWMENEDTNWTKQTTQETDKYCSGIYSIIHNNKSGVTIGYKSEEF